MIHRIFTVIRLIALFTSLSAMAACVAQPRNDQRVSPGTQLDFQGRTTYLSTIRIEARLASGGWTQIGQGEPSAANPFVEGTTNWYTWSVKATLPSKLSNVWGSNAHGARERAGYFRAMQGNIELATFNADADSCWYHTPGGTWNKIAACKSKESPVLRLWIPCGATGQACCDKNGGFQCESGAACSAGGCETCGGSGKVCCDDGSCGSGLACGSGNTCTPCGGKGQICCDSGAECGTRLTCNGSNRCDCGDNLEPCCADGPLCERDSRNLQCYLKAGSAGVCMRPSEPEPSCGAKGEKCCTSGESECDPGNTCWNKKCYGPPAGEGEICADHNSISPCAKGLACNNLNGKCERQTPATPGACNDVGEGCCISCTADMVTCDVTRAYAYCKDGRTCDCGDAGCSAPNHSFHYCI